MCCALPVWRTDCVVLFCFVKYLIQLDWVLKSLKLGFCEWKNGANKTYTRQTYDYWSYLLSPSLFLFDLSVSFVCSAMYMQCTTIFTSIISWINNNFLHQMLLLYIFFKIFKVILTSIVISYMNNSTCFKTKSKPGWSMILSLGWSWSIAVSVRRAEQGALRAMLQRTKSCSVRIRSLIHCTC